MKKQMKRQAAQPAQKPRLSLRRALLLGLLGMLLVVMPTLAGSSSNYILPWDTVASGGNAMSSPNYSMQSTVGQSSIGPATSSDYTLGAGYWYGVSEPAYTLYLPLTNRP